MTVEGSIINHEQSPNFLLFVYVETSNSDEIFTKLFHQTLIFLLFSFNKILYVITIRLNIAHNAILKRLISTAP